ncbi:MAG: InlB B-repeat-containing protein [Treponema sp.]|nr:InlB B-repeat-containing protein [Treponema sp.]
MKRFARIAALLFAAAIILGLSGCKKEPEIAYYTVSFDTDGAGDIASQKVAEGKVAAKPDDPAKTGYTFGGWYNGETAFDFATAITADTNLKAKWELIKSSVTVSDTTTGGTISVDKAENVAYGETVTITPGSTALLKSITVKDAEGKSITVTNNTFVMPDSNVTIFAEFWFGTKASTASKEIGDIIFTDGTSTPYDDFKDFPQEVIDGKKEYVVAVIFYKGSGLNDSGTNDRILGVGFKKEVRAWCIATAQAYNTSITSIQSSNSIATNGITVSGNYNGSDHFEKISTFLQNAEGKTDDTDDAEKYPAFYFAKNYKSFATNIEGCQFAEGWYLPSLAELYEITRRLSMVDSINTLLGNDIFESNAFWSSTQSSSSSNNDNKKAAGLNFNSTLASITMFDIKMDYTWGNALAIHEF